MIAIDNSLLKKIVKIFIKKEAIVYSKDLLNIIKYIQPPIVIGRFQIHDIRALSQSGSLIRSVNANNEIELAKKTKLKLILSKNNSNYPYVNINQDEFESNFTATYSANANKQKVLDHIKDLCQSGDNIEIYDKYLFHNNGNINDVDDNHFSVKVINEIISCCNNQNITLNYKNRGKNSIETNKIQQRVNNLSSYSNLYHNHILNNAGDHDRYIRIKKNGNLIYEIVLSSGIYNILGNKDFTYVVRTF